MGKPSGWLFALIIGIIWWYVSFNYGLYDMFKLWYKN